MAEIKRLTLKKPTKQTSPFKIWLFLSTRYALRTLWRRGIGKLVLILPAIPLLSALANVGFHIVFPMMAGRKPTLVEPYAITDSSAFPIFLYTVVAWSQIFSEVIHSDYLIMARYRKGGKLVPLALASGPLFTNIIPMIIGLLTLLIAQLSVSHPSTSLYIEILDALARWCLANTLAIAIIILMLSLTRSYQLAMTMSLLILPIWSIGLEILRNQIPASADFTANLSLARHILSPSSPDLPWMVVMNTIFWIPAYLALLWRVKKGGK